MSWIVANIEWIMIASGLLTATMLHVAVAPEGALRSMFGETLEGPLARIIVRNWAILIALVGAMLVYGAYTPPNRSLVLVVAGVSKLAYIVLLLSEARRYLKGQAALSIAVDGVMVALFAWYLLAAPASQTS